MMDEKKLRKIADAAFVPSRLGLGHIATEESVRDAVEKAYSLGLRAGLTGAADFIEEQEREFRISRYRIGDRIRCKFNLWRRSKPRLFRRRKGHHEERGK